MVRRPQDHSLRIDDGAEIHSPTTDEAIAFQRRLIKDLKTFGHGTGAIPDPNTPGKFLTRGELFDQRARVMMVIAEVEERASRSALHETNH